jgi:hypothetical protein
MDEVNPGFVVAKMTAAVIATIGLYTVLYRENKFYRFFEHLFLGLAAGWTVVALWSDTLFDLWWSKMVGSVPEAGATGASANGYWIYALLLPVGIMGYLVYSKKHNWISRIPIGVILGLWSGQQLQVWFNRYGPQINDSLKPLIPNTWDRLTVPVPPAAGWAPGTGPAPNALFLSSAISNLIFVLTFVCVLSYFLFSFDVKNKVLAAMTTSGRWLLMVGFGAIFGSTVMMRFTLLIDRMYYIWIEWLSNRILPMLGGGGGG